MTISENRLRRIIREEIEGELNEQGFISNVIAGAKGAVAGAVGGAQQGGLSGALKGAVGGAQAGAALNQRIADAAATVRTSAAVGNAPTLMAKMDEGSLSLYLMDWGGLPNNPQAQGRALWALLKLLTIQRERFNEELYGVAGKATKSLPGIGELANAISELTNLAPNDPKWKAAFTDAIVKNKVV